MQRIRYVLLTVLAGLATAPIGCGPAGISPHLARLGDAVADGGDTQYTVLLKVFHGPDHERIASIYRQRLAGELGWRGLSVVTAMDHSELYWGAFDSVDEARPTLKRAWRHRAATGIAPFSGATITLLPGTGGGAIGKWDIRNCPGAYSLLVAVFQDQPEADPPYVGRRDFAVAYCKQLRQQGHDAYYHHGPRSSSVTIGSFGPDAIEMRKRPVRVPTSPRPIYVEQAVPVGPALLAMMREFPNRGYNGREFENVQRDHQGKIISRTPARTVAIRVPGKDTQEQTQRANDRSGDLQPW